MNSFHIWWWWLLYCFQIGFYSSHPSNTHTHTHITDHALESGSNSTQIVCDSLIRYVIHWTTFRRGMAAVVFVIKFFPFFLSLETPNFRLWSIFGHEIEPNPRQNANKREQLNNTGLALPVVLLSIAPLPVHTMCLSSVLLRRHSMCIMLHYYRHHRPRQTQNTTQQTSSSSFQWTHWVSYFPFDSIRWGISPFVYDCVK